MLANPSSIILDGEMMVWDPVLDKYLAFGSLKTAALGMIEHQHKLTGYRRGR